MFLGRAKQPVCCRGWCWCAAGQSRHALVVSPPPPPPPTPHRQTTPPLVRSAVSQILYTHTHTHINTYVVFVREGCVFDLEHSNARRSASVRPSVRPLAVSAAAAAASRRLRLLLLLHILRSPPTPRLARQVLYTIHAHPYNIVCCAFFNFFL